MVYKLGMPNLYQKEVKNMQKFVKIAAILLAALSIFAGCVQQPAQETAKKELPAPVQKPKVTIALMPTENVGEISPRAKELEDFLEARINADVEIYIPMTYSAVVESLRFGHAQVGFMSAWPAYFSNKLAGADIVLAENREVIIDDRKVVGPFYYSYYVVLKDSPYAKLEDLKGKKVAYTSAVSTSGYLFPVAKLVEKGYISKPGAGKEADPNEFFGAVVLAGGYAQAWEALKRGQVDVAVIAGDVSEKLYNEVLNSTKVLEKQGPVPSHVVVFSKDLKEPLRSELISALMELNKPEQRGLMRKLVSGIFVEFKKTTSEEHLAGLAGAINATGFKFAEKIG